MFIATSKKSASKKGTLASNPLYNTSIYVCMYVCMYVCIVCEPTPGGGGLVRSQAIEQIEVGDLVSQLGLQLLGVGSLGVFRVYVCMYVCMYLCICMSV